MNGDRFLARVQNEKFKRSWLAVGGQETKVHELLRAVNAWLGGHFYLEWKIEEFGPGGVRFDPEIKNKLL